MSVALILDPLIDMLSPAVYLVSVAEMTLEVLIDTFVPAVYLVSVALILEPLIDMLSPTVNLSCLLSCKSVTSFVMSAISDVFDATVVLRVVTSLLISSITPPYGVSCPNHTITSR